VLSLAVGLLVAFGDAQRCGVGVPPVSSTDARLASEWLLHDGRHWQRQSETLEPADVTDAQEHNRRACPAGMVEVSGRAKIAFSGEGDQVDVLQEEACTEWLSTEWPERCATYDRERWLALSANLPTEALSFCIDRFEYPNIRGAFPWIVVTWNEASALCSEQGKRLCTEQEWTFACEGEEAMPYPYGYERADDACVIDRPWIHPDELALLGRSDTRALREIDRLWQGEASGSRPRCRSPFGVYDLTGNVDEWTTSVLPTGQPSILKGGYWGPVRTRCRASTRVHGPNHAYYQQGFRCCAGVPGSADAGQD
jgi:hypothetical protein